MHNDTQTVGSVLIFGLGREGLSTYQYLRTKSPNLDIVLLDEKPLSELSPSWQEIATHPHTHVTQTLPENLDYPVAYCSPGIPPHAPLFIELTQRRATISSNLELFFSELKSINPAIKTIGVTGTKGKSTTSALIQHLLETANHTSFYAGNMGIPPLEVIPAIRAAAQSNKNQNLHVVLELSSHQLSRVSTSPHIAVIQEIVPEHLDYYDSFETYLEAKATIAKFQTKSDHLIYSSDFDSVVKLAEQSPAQKHVFSLENPDINQLSKEISVLLNQTTTSLLGKHNHYNMAPSYVVAQLLEIPLAILEKALTTFTPLPHRLEPVKAPNSDVLFVNDSLATTPEATIAALEAFSEKHIILIAGGYDRSLDFHALAKKILAAPIKALILFPPTGEKIIGHMYKIEPTHPLIPDNYFKVETMSEAVHIAKKMAKSGDVVLMSPAAASFGRFKNYEDRGNQFKQFVQED